MVGSKTATLPKNKYRRIMIMIFASVQSSTLLIIEIIVFKTSLPRSEKNCD